MARPPAGPIGNSPRDVRDDAVGVPAENVNAPEPPRWPPKPKKITKNTFHANVSGSKSSKRADRAPHFRKGGWVSGYASGGSVASKMEKREELPSDKKNDPFAKQNLKRGGGVKKKLADGGIAGPSSEEDRKEGVKKLGGEMEREMSRGAGLSKPFANAKTLSSNISRYVRPELTPERGGYRKGGAVKKADGGEIEIANKPPVMPDKPFEHTGSQEPGPGLREEEFPQKLARGINATNRFLGRPPNMGAVGVQQYADKKRTQQISDEVPRRPASFAGPGGIGSRKSGGGVKK